MNKQLLAFEVMAAVKEHYTREGVSDSAFAKQLTERLGADVSTARVRQARMVLGIANNTSDATTLAEAKQHIANLLDMIDRYCEDDDEPDLPDEYYKAREFLS